MSSSAIIAALLRDGHNVRFPAHGISMAPAIRSGDYLLVEPAHSSRVRCGDVVLTLTHRGLTAHRVVSIDPDRLRFTTRGDNAPASDEPFGVDALLGHVVATERAGRSVSVPTRPPVPRFLAFLRFLGGRFTGSQSASRSDAIRG